MRLFKLTLSTLLRRNTWVICALMVTILPFVLPQISSSTENPSLVKPALAQAAWVMAWLSAAFWGYFAAAQTGEHLSKSGLGEYFHSQGVSATRQLFQVWLAVFTFVAPLGMIAALVSVLAASPANPSEKTLWIATNFQYALLFASVVAPLIALAIACASRFGSVSGFLVSCSLSFYGLYGVGYVKQLISVENSRVLTWLWSASPHYHFADPTERLRYKLGAIEWSQFPLLLAYFGGIALLYIAISRWIFRVRATA